MNAHNDNVKPDWWDETIAVMKKSPNWKHDIKFTTTALRSGVCQRTKREAQNFAWFARFEEAYRQNEIQYKRDGFEVV